MVREALILGLHTSILERGFNDPSIEVSSRLLEAEEVHTYRQSYSRPRGQRKLMRRNPPASV